METLTLAHQLNYTDLYHREGLSRLDKAFVSWLETSDLEVHNRFLGARRDVDTLSAKEVSAILLEVAPYLEDFIAHLFNIEKEVHGLKANHSDLANIYSVKRLFVQRQAIKKYPANQAQQFDGAALRAELHVLFGEAFSETLFADVLHRWLQDKEQYQNEIDCAARYAAWAVHTEEGNHWHKEWVLFTLPKKLDFANLVPVETEIKDGVTIQKIPATELRSREGFALTDPGGTLKQALDEANYCIYCHNQGKDSCSKGLKEKEGGFKSTPHKVQQAGCPLEEKISEMNTLKAAGIPIGALAMVVVDNPMCAATGHRICNDCMKSCIYQKQEPVNIPRTETTVLQNVLDLPWGFEIYSLLTRWNPLHLERPLPRLQSGYKVLVAGLGPAGFTLAHHLLNEGHTVVAVEGLKIEPLPAELSGVDNKGKKVSFQPVKHINALYEALDDRILAGFGGVAEYGITVRWNKNYLKIIRLLLERRTCFAMYGGIRFGSTLTYDDVWNLGFDHVALAMGAGKPTIINIPNIMARGVRAASDFLMSLQLTGAAKKNSIANLQLRLPVVVIGGGLTAIDTATESLAYYPVQVEKFLTRYEILCAEKGEKAIRAQWNEEETLIAEEYLAHAKALRLEKQKAYQEKRSPELLPLLNQWGGVQVVYRRKLQDAPAYRLNHEEVELAMQEGISFIENATPVSVKTDQYHHAHGLEVEVRKTHDEKNSVIIPARSIFIAAGTNPNTILKKEQPAHVELEGKFFAAINEEGERITPEPNTSKPAQATVLMAKNSENKFTSFFGDLHPSYVGNVVKAMGAAKQGYPVISQILKKAPPANNESPQDFIEKMNGLCIATIEKVVRLTKNIVEVVVKAPAAARQFHPGQFYRLQNYESYALQVKNSTGEKTVLAMEGLALTGAWVDKEKGLLSTIVLEMGGSSDLCTYLKSEEPVVLMGPTGMPTEIPHNETVMLVGGGLGNAVLFSIGRALRQQGCKVLYFAGYKKAEDRYKVKEIEAAADVIVWACDEAVFTPERPQDRSFHGNIVEAILSYGKGMLGKESIHMQEVNRIIAIGSDRMMHAVTVARHTVLKDLLPSAHIAIGSINSPMQCMMKEICAQCLQRHVDPQTGEESYVYSCFNQDQYLDRVDFTHLHERLKQNTVQEKLTKEWINHCLRELKLRNQ